MNRGFQFLLRRQMAYHKRILLIVKFITLMITEVCIVVL
jgi:hypothetical protein